jgi:hypothetical protein
VDIGRDKHIGGLPLRLGSFKEPSYRRTTYDKSITLKLKQGLFDWVSSNRGA